MRNVTRYSEAFKLRLVEDVAGGKYKSLRKRGEGTAYVAVRPWSGG
jgi:transposase-like protein